MFAHLKKLDIAAGKTISLTFEEIPGEPTLFLANAGSSNPTYFNLALKDAKKKAKATGKVTADSADVNREEDRKNYPGTVVVGWKNVLDADGKEVEYSDEDCVKLLNAFPNWLFDRIRNIAADPINYVEEELVKN